MKKLYILSIILCIGFLGFAQKPEKVLSSSVFKAMDSRVQADIDSEMDKARQNFKKILLKEKNNALANIGLSIVYSYDKYSKRDYFEAWKYFQIADENSSQIVEGQLEVLNEYFFKQDKKRRNRPLNKNMEWERRIVEDKLIKFVREENKLEHADRFLEEFPDSKYIKNVEHIRTYIDYRIAEDANTVESYNAFLQKYADAAQKEIATLKRNKIAYKKAVEANSLFILKAFVKNYPEAVEVEDAYKLMSLLAYDEAAKTRTLEALEQFMRQYPNSTKMPEAKILKKQLLFEWAKSVNTIEAYNKFVALYPEGKYYIDIFNLKAGALGQQLLMDFPMENYVFIKGYDNQQFKDFGGSVIKRPNGEIVLIANSKKSKDDMYDTWLLGLDQNGNMTWNSFLGNKYDDFANKVEVNNKNEIFVAGITNAILDSIPGQAWIYKLDADGSNVYNTKLEASEVLGFGIYENGSAIVGSYSINEADSTNAPLIIKVNKDGKKLWSRSYSSTGKVYDLSVANNIAYLTTGNWVCAIDENGYLKWDKYLTEGQLITAVGNRADGSVVYVGKKGQEGYTISFDASGNKLWEQTYPSPGIGNYKEVTLLGDGSMLLAGTFSNAINITKIGSDGSLLKQKEFSLPYGISLNGIQWANDNFVIISATKMGKKSDVVVFKMGF